jgi:hypothetical protein
MLYIEIKHPYGAIESFGTENDDRDEWDPFFGRYTESLAETGAWLARNEAAEELRAWARKEQSFADI